MIEIISLELPIPQDPNEIVQIQVLVWEIGNQSRLRLIGLSKSKIVITSVHLALRVSLRPHYAVHVK